MNLLAWLPLVVPAVSFITGLAIFTIPEARIRLRDAISIGGAALKLGLVLALLSQRAAGLEPEARLAFLPGMDFVLRADFLALLFLTLSAILWLLTTIYAIGYLEGSPNRSRFFGYFSLCIAATSGIALAGNLATFFVFYEILTLATFPLIVHHGSGEALAAGRVYLLYTLSGGIVFLAGVVWLHGIAGPIEFQAGGALAGTGAPRDALTAIFSVLVIGLGVKTALVPLHGWLPQAMVAPAPVSALLHAVAVVKAGAFGIVRVIHDVYGLEFAASLGVLLPLAFWAGFTIIYGSLRALVQDDLKRLLAYSTVSQLSYIVLGAAVPVGVATAGALAHLVHQGVMKITLFYCAGVVAETLGIRRISAMGGVGRRLPLTMAAFTVAALGMIGLPPTAGFVSKWYLATGGLAEGEAWVVWVMVASTLLNMLYFFPVLRTVWFDAPSTEVRELPLREAGWQMVGPPIVTAAVTLAAGIFAGMELSPLGLAALAVVEAQSP